MTKRANGRLKGFLPLLPPLAPLPNCLPRITTTFLTVNCSALKLGFWGRLKFARYCSLVARFSGDTHRPYSQGLTGLVPSQFPASITVRSSCTLKPCWWQAFAQGSAPASKTQENLLFVWVGVCHFLNEMWGNAGDRWMQDVYGLDQQ